MKKLLAALSILLVAFLLLVYFLLPATQKPQLALKLQANQKALLRRLVQQSLQQKNYSNKNELVLGPGMFDGVVLSVPLKDTVHNSILHLIELGPDSTVASWDAVVQGGNLPWQRWHTWQQSKQLKKQAGNFMENLRRWESGEQLYGLYIKREQVRDTALVAVRFKTDTYPATADIYTHVDLLKQYISVHKASVTNYPMLHVRQQLQSFEVMVGLPASKDLPDNGPIMRKRMVSGNILTAEVKGGNAAVQKGMRQLEDYVSDHDLISPAIPFVSLVTDRRQEPDSSKWVSKLYYPIF